MKAYLVSHNGLGDNMFMIGALRFLITIYDDVLFLCKNKYYENVKLFFLDCPTLICIPFDETKEHQEIYDIIYPNYLDINADIFICGYIHKMNLSSKITNPLLFQHLSIEKKEQNYTIEYDTLTSQNYDFIEGFYKDIGLNLSYFYDSFDIPSTQESLQLYKMIQPYSIIFIQKTCSDGRSIDISKLIEKYRYDNNTILICNDENLYENISNKTPEIQVKYELCKCFICNKIVYYKDIILHANEIYIIDSCFIGIILPYLKTNRLNASIVRIIVRDQIESNILFSI